MRRWQAALGAVLTSWTMTGHAAEIGIAAFNIAWAGSEADFAEHVRVCSAQTVNWCNTRTKPAINPPPEEVARAKQCQVDFDSVAGGQAKALLVPPCNAYKLDGKKGAKASPAAYAEKLAGLRGTVDDLISNRRIDVVAFQEVRSAAVIKSILGKHAADFEACVADHSAFQTVGFAWRRSISSKPGKCTAEKSLAIKEHPGDPGSLKHVRPGLALGLQIGKDPITLMNVHLKSSCANLNAGSGFPPHLLTDQDSNCEVLNRQVAPLESWIEAVAKTSPLFVVLGDFNRKLDEEAAANVAPNQVRSDGTDPAKPNKQGPNGEVKSRYLWQELSDGDPSMAQIPLTLPTDCKGFEGLDHILISEALKARQSNAPTSEKLKVEQRNPQTIATSDHCPRVTVLTL